MGGPAIPLFLSFAITVAIVCLVLAAWATSGREMLAGAVLATLIAWVWLGEVPRPISLLGGTIAICGVVIVNLWGKSRRVDPLIPVETES